MENGTDSDVANRTYQAMSYFNSLRVVAAPLATIAGLAGVILYFAAGAWVRGIVQEEVASIVTGNSEASTLLTQHASAIERHDGEIDDNEEEIDEVDDKFTQFVRDVIAKL